MIARSLKWLACILVAALGMAGCDAGPAPDAPGARPTFVPAVTLFVTPQPQAVTPGPPEAEPADVPTLPPATQTPEPLSSAINPFTGLPVADPADLERIPLLIKVANSPEVRPQHGLGQADVVVEHYAEGGFTRFSALYLTHSPAKVGSVRSCRLIDIELPRMFGAALVCSGTSPGVKPTLRASWLFDNGQQASVNDSVVIISDFGPFECPTCPMFRTSDRVPPHNLFANTPNAWREMAERGKNAPTAFRSWSFSAQPPVAGRAVSLIDIPYAGDPASWRYDAAAGVWERRVRGEPHLEAETGVPLTAANVVVVFAHHATTDIQEDTTGARSVQIQLWGEGPLQVYRDGRVVEGKWKRPADPNVFELVDAGGAPIPLKPGNTWLEVVPLDFGVQAR